MYTITKIVLTFVHAKKKISMGKIKFCGLFFIGGLVGLLSSCLNSNNYEIEEWMISNAQISAFYLSCDSISGLDSVKFTIDQVNGKIYNKDSMRYGTVIGHKVLAEIETDNPYGIYKIIFIEQATGDTVQSVLDSIDFSAPVMIVVTAYDGIMEKTYEAKLNIHQVNPDAMIWEKYADILPGKTFQDMKVVSFNGYFYMYVFENSIYQLYRSDIQDMVDWEKLDLTGFPEQAKLSQMTAFEDEWVVLSEDGILYNSKDGQAWRPVETGVTIHTILGYLPASSVSGRHDVLSCIAETDGVLYFISLDNQWTITHGKEVPETFPVSGFGQFHYETMYYPRLVITAGRDSKNNLSDKAYATMDGLTWATLTNRQSIFSIREGATAFYYDNCFFLIGGNDDSGEALKDIRFSKDQGISWLYSYMKKVYEGEEEEEDSEYIFDISYNYDEDEGRYYLYYEREYYPMNIAYEPRGFSSVFIDKDNYILLFGGKAKKDTNVLNEIWRGRINRLGFKAD